ncbi:MAG: DEAD/DEAH box helicase, partial [Oligosphaeraceae bacterium]|nr:DEAD/DEAH box helicase [Oligosphaeraceae bacterium]
PYQFEGVKYLWRTSSLGLGTCLADDMGLGKTLQVLALLQLWQQRGVLQGLPVLLVLPATLLANWKNESERFTPGLKIAILHNSVMDSESWQRFKHCPEKYLSQFDLVLVTYGMLPRLPQLSGLCFPAVIADEAQAIKNPAAKQSKAVRGLQGRVHIALTGTPVENRLTDLWSIFAFVNPGLLGDLRFFLDYSKRLNADYTPLRKLTQPFILRRLKTDKRIISDLPDKTELKVYCSLSKRQAALYQHCVEQMQQALQDESEGIRRQGIVLAYLMRFKQICNHPGQFLGDGDYTPAAGGKFLRLGELVESISSRQEKLLLFTQFRELTEPVHDYLQGCFGCPGLILHGGTPVKARAGLVSAFQADSGPPFFVLSLKAAGTGLNLTAASHVIHFDRWWNPAVENQASDRAFRIGQKRNVLVHKFICRGTLEEKIDALIMDKQHLADELLNEGAEKLLTQMTNAELLDFVKLDIHQME